MTIIRKELVPVAINRSYALVDANIQNNLEKRHEFIRNNEGTKRICEDCQVGCLATLYCEHCVRNYLKTNSSNWSSGNNDIDNLIQMETISPRRIQFGLMVVNKGKELKVVLMKLKNFASANRSLFEELLDRGVSISVEP
ncbi:hypothetical protein C1645_821306 [Glomus cerebriforme]|uniref:Uncharacterized protein n=1 Tax=Glomus cerebriforme TaxID=658196 RepID=A0A397T3M3_9GLOM|nr:hypothetical protein C1645_821306 [Glomus cerebriforme]